MTEHSMLPWRVVDHAWDASSIVSAEDYSIATLSVEDNEETADAEQACMDANAAFIVRACNCHDELVQMLEEARRSVDAHAHETNAPMYLDRLARLDAILAKARGETL